MEGKSIDGGVVQKLLNAHARTFALTLRLLPRTMREPLGITYLLARASDTVADTTSIPLDRRLALLEGLAASLDGEKSLPRQPRLAAGEGTPSEHELLAAVPSLASLLEQLPDAREMFLLWRRILEGQLFDLRRFSSVGLPLTREELEGYCLLVAGSVGESWTSLIAKHAPKVLRPSSDGGVGMIKLGISYGKGLQMLNIIRDRAADGKLGRIYLQEKDVPEMISVAAAWLKEGREYCCRLRPGRIRYATEIPLRLAQRTLDHIRDQPDIPGVKISRREVYGVLLKTLPSLVLPGAGNPAS